MHGAGCGALCFVRHHWYFFVDIGNNFIFHSLDFDVLSYQDEFHQEGTPNMPTYKHPDNKIEKVKEVTLNSAAGKCCSTDVHCCVLHFVLGGGIDATN